MTEFEIRLQDYEFGDEAYEDEVISSVEKQLESTLGLKHVSTVNNIESHRWADTCWLIFANESAAFWAVAFDVGSTEDQPCGFIYSQPVLFRVYPHEKTIVQWVKSP